MTNEKTVWFIIHSEDGASDPIGFHCYKCFHNRTDKEDLFKMGLVTTVDPNESLSCKCNTCGKDYRDE